MQTIIVDTWTNYKALVASKTLSIQYESSDVDYKLYSAEGGTFLWSIILNKGTSDATDFENNYKALANAPLMIGGAEVSSPNVSEGVLFNAEPIRDTAAHNSAASANTGYRVKTVIVNNGLNQIVTMQCQGSRDNTNWINIGGTWDVATATWTYQSCDTYFPYMRAIATCSVAPASGTLSMWLEKVGV